MQDQCKACRKVTDRQTYLRRSEEQRERYRQWNRLNMERNVRLTYEYLLEHPCVDCGEADPIVLEFDHVSGEKRGNIGDMIGSGRTWKRLLIEIEKCEVRCANCHRRVTARRAGTKRHLWGSEDNTPT